MPINKRTVVTVMVTLLMIAAVSMPLAVNASISEESGNSTPYKTTTNAVSTVAPDITQNPAGHTAQCKKSHAGHVTLIETSFQFSRSTFRCASTFIAILVVGG